VLFLIVSLGLSTKVCGPSSSCGGFISGIRANSNLKNCSFIDFSQDSGQIMREMPFPPCSDRGNQSIGVPKSALEWAGGYIYWTSGNGAHIWQTDTATTDCRPFATLPPAYDYIVGMYYLSYTGLYVLTTSTLYFIPQNDNSHYSSSMVLLSSVVDLKLSQNAVVVGDYYTPIIYVSDGPNLYVINVADNTNVAIQTVKFDSLTNIIDLQVYEPDEDTTLLVALQDWSLYYVDPADGSSKYVMDIIKGVGKPWDNSLSFTTFYVADETQYYAYDLSVMQNIVQQPFNGTGWQGLFQYHP